MKSALILTMALLAGLVAPQKALASDADVLNALELVGAVAAVVAIEASDLESCRERGYNCAYYNPRTRCEYRVVPTEQYSTSCRKNGYYGRYSCVTIRQHSEYYYEVCSGY